MRLCFKAEGGQAGGWQAGRQAGGQAGDGPRSPRSRCQSKRASPANLALNVSTYMEIQGLQTLKMER